MPSDALFDGFLILLAGIFLVAPGILTDFLGFALLLPPIRNLVKRIAKGWLKKNMHLHVARFHERAEEYIDARPNEIE